MRIGQLFKNKIAKNASWLIVGKIGQMLINLIVGLLTARYLGPSNYGLIGYAGAYTAFFTSLCTLGINSVLVKELLEHPEGEGEILGSSIMMRLLSSILSVFTIIGIVSIADAGESVTIWVVALCSLGAIFHVFEVFNYWFQARLQSKVASIVALVAYAVTAVYKVILIVLDKSVVYFAIATSIDYILVAVLLYVSYRRCQGKRLTVSRSTCKRILSRSCHFILPGLMVAVYGQTDKLMMKHMIGTDEIGYYTTAVTICTLWCFVLSAVIDSMYPPIMEANKAQNEEDFEKKNRLLYAIVFYMSVIVSMFITLLARPAVSIFYGSAYLPAVTPLRIITWYTAFSYLGVARGAWIVAKDKQKYLIWIYLSAAVANVLLNLALIPLWGASGAALASLIAQIVTTMVAPFFIKPIRRNTVLMLEAICLRGIGVRKDMRSSDSTI